nr:glycosyltransferase family 4 protein [uncultured Sphaerochaeta sp.]
MIESPVFAIISTGIRRDLLEPIRHFCRLKVVHFYREAVYGDLTDEDLSGDLIAYSGPWSLFRRLSRARPDLIQGVEPFQIRMLPYMYAAYAVALLRGKPMVMICFENRPLDLRRPLKRFLLRTFLRPVFRYARLIMVVNDGAQRNVLTVGPYQAKVRRLMYGTWGVDLEDFSPIRDGREPDLGPGPVLLFVGRLNAEKGIFDLMDAFDRIRLERPDCRLVLIGDGPARGDLERRIVTSGCSDRVKLVGMVKHRDLAPYFRAADIFVAPSVTTRRWEEQVGMTNIQAMACGLPVVSTESGAIPEYVPHGRAGLLVRNTIRMHWPGRY